ncbi:hypothetical protein ZWY2020_029214 [Hordeum vulgare]|nr:hypothetical protein ZWY2020_029214 [Hordeum vulgare]
MEEEIQADQIPQVTIPAMTTEEKVGDEDIGCNTPVIHDEFWEEAHPNSTRTAPIPQIPVATKILTGSEERISHVESAQDPKSAASAEEIGKETAAPKIVSGPSNQQIPQAEEHAPSQNAETAIVVFYATLHISGDPKDVNSWVLDWLTHHTHYKAPTTELLRATPLPVPSDEAIRLYDERELPNHLMEVLMKPLAPGQPPRTRFLVKELQYVSRTVYRILSYSIAPIKGHDKEEDVVAIMKNIMFHVVHGNKMNLQDFFLRTLADNALSPFELKIYAP